MASLFPCQHSHVLLCSAAVNSMGTSAVLSVPPWVLLHLCLSLGVQRVFPVVQGCLQCLSATEQANLVGPGAGSRPYRKLRAWKSSVSLPGL